MSVPPPKSKRISKYLFFLSGSDKLYFKHATEASFRPARKKNHITNRSAIPTFLNDRHHFTSAFHLPSEAPISHEELREDHLRRVREATQDITEFYFPKPRSRNKYCGVCRGHYEDYKDHVESDSHMLALRSSPYQHLITKFCGRLAALRQAEEAKGMEEAKGAELSTVEQRSEKGMELPDFFTPTKLMAP